MLSYDTVKNYVENDTDCKLLSDSYEGWEKRLEIQCGCGEVFTPTLASFQNSRHKKCSSCVGRIMRRRFSFSHAEVEKYFEDNGCELLSKEYINMKTSLTYIARCGHENTASFDSFKNSKHKLCRSCSRVVNSGAKAYNWNGGYDSEKIKFRKTYEFKQFVKEVLKRDKYTCQKCGDTGVQLNAHHLDGYNWCVEKRTDVDNGVTLCKNCHEEFHSIYGRGNNTKEQFEEWIQNIQ